MIEQELRDFVAKLTPEERNKLAVIVQNWNHHTEEPSDCKIAEVSAPEDSYPTLFVGDEII